MEYPGCKDCEHGSEPNALSDICDGCTSDPDTGWGGFTDHSIGKHFYSEEERLKYLKDNGYCNLSTEEQETDDDEETKDFIRRVMILPINVNPDRK